MEINKTEAVVFIHGLFMNGWDMSLLKNWISNGGYDVHQFSYSSTGTNIEQVVEDLKKTVEEIDKEKVHFVCHSLGGLVIRYYLDKYPNSPEGRVVTLGSPHNGSETAHFFKQFNLVTMFLGESLQSGLLGNAPDWVGSRELGSIAGSLGFGIGSLFNGLEVPNDGTVSVSETKLEKSTDHYELAVSHTGLVLSKLVADQVLSFIENGEFNKN